MILSIGMIVKNEEKYLDECLTALQPILNNLDSELIIVDTGSTDNTVEIAKKYTDKVYNFEWCNDFAAARNVTLDHAKGEWYMFLDADEILMNASEIITFFKSKEYKKYEAASYNILNYRNKEKTSSLSILIPRMRKLKKGLRFIGIVHEYLPVSFPIKDLTNTVFEHYGYVFLNQKQSKNKHKRNTDLLLSQLNTIKDNSKLRNELGESYLLDNNEANRKEALKHFKVGKDLAIEEKNNNMYCTLAVNLISLYIKMSMNVEALDEIELYFKSKSDEIATDIDVYYLMTFAFSALNKHDSCVESFAKYEDSFNKYKNKKYTTRELYCRGLAFTDNYSFYRASLNSINSYIKLEKYEEAKHLIIQMIPLSCDFKENQDYLFKLYLELMKCENCYNELLSLYKIECNRNEEFESNLEKTIEIFINENKEEKDKIVNTFCMFDDTTDLYINLMKIRFANNNNLPNIKEMIITYLNNIDKFEVYYADIIYYMIKSNIPLKLLKGKLNINDLYKNFDLLNNQYDNFIDEILNYDYVTNDPFECSIIKSMYESAMVLIDDFENKEIGINLFNKYLDSFINFADYTFNKNIFNDEDIVLAPNNIQFGYYCLKANEYLSNNEELNYVKSLRKALDTNNAMKNIISILIDNFKEVTKSNSKELSEFEILANTVKNNIKELLKTNMLNEARLILNEYKQLNPNDPEILVLEKKFK